MTRPRRRKGADRALVNGRRLTAAQTGLLRAAERAERLGDAGLARRLRLAVERAQADAADADWRGAALAETARLEAARGATVEIRPGRVRVSGRDGLETLRAAGAIDARQAAAGLRYRDRLESARREPVSALAIRPGGGRGRPDAAEGLAARLAQASRELEGMERAVAAHYRSEDRPGLAADALMALREVAGLGRSIRDLARSGGRRAALKARLVEALDAVAGARAQDR